MIQALLNSTKYIEEIDSLILSHCPFKFTGAVHA